MEQHAAWEDEEAQALRAKSLAQLLARNAYERARNAVPQDVLFLQALAAMYSASERFGRNVSTDKMLKEDFDRALADCERLSGKS